jgi:hypothetical protein
MITAIQSPALSIPHLLRADLRYSYAVGEGDRGAGFPTMFERFRGRARDFLIRVPASNPPPLLSPARREGIYIDLERGGRALAKIPPAPKRGNSYRRDG